MKEQLISKINEILSLLGHDGELMQIAERYLNNDSLADFLGELMMAENAINRALRDFNKNAEMVNEQDIDELGALAQALDETGDPVLMKQASVLDEILITIGADPKAQAAFKKAQDDEIERLRAKYQDTNRDQYTRATEEHRKEINVNEAIKEIDRKIKKYRPLEASLSTRYSPDMPGVSLVRIGDSVWQCPITKKIYDYRSGFTTTKGNVVPGGDVSNQTQHLGYRAQEHMNFSTREELLNGG